MNSGSITSVLFVCLGNICRSPLAHAVMLDLIERNSITKQLRVDSCGTGGWHIGAKAHRGSIAIAAEHGIDLNFHRARQFCENDWNDFGLIVVMDRDNLATLTQMRSVKRERIRLLREYEPNKINHSSLEIDVPDPYYDGKFNEVFTIINRCCGSLFKSILNSV